MQDVAREAGVSPQTVSRVANHSNAVKPATRRRVEDAMQKLGYRPNYAARALKHGHFKNIGVVLFNLTSYGNARILSGITDAAVNNDYAVTLLQIGTDLPHTLQAVVNRMKQLPVDGIIVILEHNVSDTNAYIPLPDLPVVLISEEPADHCPTVDADQYGCSIAIVDYLLSLGHSTVYHVTGPSSSRAAQSRLKGWRDALQQVGAPIPQTYIGDWNADSGYQAGLSLARDPNCTAIYAANDQMAYGIMQAYESLGKKIPRDVSIIGVDDSLVGLVPRLNLTTMRMPFEQIGQAAFDIVNRQCHGEHIPTGVKTIIPTKLIERGSIRSLE
ncbi:MAG: LacI family DNA-binding transcriptional regulator [Bifidobacterium sp.]|nr:LacI family DNA-binding transcriptional regulator [Bifidobacterium sp.]